MKHVLSAVGMLASFIFLPWWGTYVIAVLFLAYTPGYVPLLFIILLDFFAIPQEFPFASLSFLGLMLLAMFLKERIFNSVE